VLIFVGCCKLGITVDKKTMVSLGWISMPTLSKYSRMMMDYI